MILLVERTVSLIFVTAIGFCVWYGVRDAGGAWRLVLPLADNDTPCMLDEVGWIDSNGTVSCAAACPGDHKSVLWYCGGAATRTANTIFALIDEPEDPDPDTSFIFRVTYAALAGLATSFVFIAALRFAAVAILFTAAYGTVAALAWIGIDLLITSANEYARITGSCMVGLSVIGFLSLLVISRALHSAATIAKQGASVVFMNPLVLFGAVLVTALRCVTVVAGTFTILGVLGSASTVSPINGAIIRRSVTWNSEKDRDTALIIVSLIASTSAWLTVFWSHAMYVAISKLTWESGRMAKGRPRAETTRLVGMAVLGSLIRTLTWIAVATVRYVQRRVRELDNRSRTPSAAVPCAALHCCVSACDATARVALPVAYACGVVYSTTLARGFRRAIRISADEPLLFVVVGAASTVFVVIHGIACGATGASVAFFVTDDPFTIIACGLAGRAAGAFAVSPLPPALATSLVVHVGALEGENHMTLSYTDPEPIARTHLPGARVPENEKLDNVTRTREFGTDV